LLTVAADEGGSSAAEKVGVRGLMGGRTGDSGRDGTRCAAEAGGMSVVIVRPGMLADVVLDSLAIALSLSIDGHVQWRLQLWNPADAYRSLSYSKHRLACLPWQGGASDC
jgi:hypothetical protein